MSHMLGRGVSRRTNRASLTCSAYPEALEVMSVRGFGFHTAHIALGNGAAPLATAPVMVFEEIHHGGPRLPEVTRRVCRLATLTRMDAELLPSEQPGAGHRNPRHEH